MFYKKSLVTTFSFLSLSVLTPALGRDAIVEFKAAYMLPTNHLFKKIYGGNAIYGPEVTVEMCGPWYVFGAVDFLNGSGKSIGLCTPTKVNIVDMEIGLKYLMPFEKCSSVCDTDLYVGLGVLPSHVHTHDFSPDVIQNRSKWTCGGILKAGAYVTVCESFVVDLFFNYSISKFKFNCCPTAGTQSHSARTDGCWFGAGFGYRFN